MRLDEHFPDAARRVLARQPAQRKAGALLFERQIAPYCGSKGTLKFPLNKPIPYELIGRVAGLLAEQHAANTGR